MYGVTDGQTDNMLRAVQHHRLEMNKKAKRQNATNAIRVKVKVL